MAKRSDEAIEPEVVAIDGNIVDFSQGFKRVSQRNFEAYFHVMGNMSEKQLKAYMKHEKTTMLEKIIGNMMLKAAKKGGWKELEIISQKMFGKNHTLMPALADEEEQEDIKKKNTIKIEFVEPKKES